jgi:hypothetical protein
MTEQWPSHAQPGSGAWPERAGVRWAAQAGGPKGAVRVVSVVGKESRMEPESEGRLDLEGWLEITVGFRVLG